jgi:hypothetical protein
VVLDEAAAIAALIADGDISPALLQGLEDAAILQEAVGNHYEMEELTRGKKEDRGKFKLTPKQLRGGTNLAQTVDGLLMAAQVERTGEPVVIPMGETAQSQRVRMAGQRILAPAGASQLAKVGLRAGAVEQLDGAERLNRALDRIVELDRNFDPTSGARLDGVGLDGGHKFAHHAHPEMSSSRENMQMENKYVNRVKGAAEGDAAVSRFGNSMLKRLKSGAISPYELATRYQYDAPEIAVDTQGGSVYINNSDVTTGTVGRLKRR